MFFDGMFNNIMYVDIGANFTDPMFKGIYKGYKKHDPDLHHVLERGWKHRMERILVTATNLESSKESVHIANQDKRLGSTVGCHPQHCAEIEQYGEKEYYEEQLDLARINKKAVKAVGVVGLDYRPGKTDQDERKVQLKSFAMQIELALELTLPLVLHCRNAYDDMFKMLNRHYGHLRGVMHAFDGTPDQAKRLVDLGFYVGVSGCSLKTEANLEAVKAVPVHRIMVETDAPNCKIGPSYAGYKYVKTRFHSRPKDKWSPDCMVRGRSEPPQVIQVLEVVSALKKFDCEVLALVVRQTAKTMFFQEIVLSGDVPEYM